MLTKEELLKKGLNNLADFTVENEQILHDKIKIITTNFQTKITTLKSESQNQITTLKSEYQTKIKSLEQDNNKLEQEINKLGEQIKLLLSGKFNKKSEKSEATDSQFDEPDKPTPDQEEEIKQAEQEITIPEHTRKKPGRKPLPAGLTRKDIIRDLSLSEKQCSCGCIKTCIGEDVSEQLEYVPASVYVIRNIRKKYACKQCDSPNIVIALMPPQPIPKSIAGAGLLAQILVAKYCYHLPLYRQEKILQSSGIDIPRATTSLWVIKCAKLLQPLVNLLQDNITSHDVAYADETVLQVLKEPDRKPSNKSYMWVFAGGVKFSVVYLYSPTRAHTIPLDFFGDDYKGYIHCDGYPGYDAMAKVNKATLVGCMLHARRKFFDITKITNTLGLSHQAVKVFGNIAKIEHKIKKLKLNPDAIKSYREKYTVPILNQFKSWLEKNINLVPPKTAIHGALQYTLNQWPKLIGFTKDGRLDWSNNLSERLVKPFVIGRKNWLFCNSVSGANAGAVIFSITETCKHHQVDPYRYLRYVLTKLPLCQTLKDIESLLPYNLDRKYLEI